MVRASLMIPLMRKGDKERNLISAYKYLKSRNKSDGTRLFSAVSSNRIMGANRNIGGSI